VSVRGNRQGAGEHGHRLTAAIACHVARAGGTVDQLTPLLLHPEHEGGRHARSIALRLLAHSEAEQLLLKVLGVTLIVAALAEAVHVSAVVGAFLVGLSLTGETAKRARKVVSPLRDLSPRSSSSPSACP
jgi:hypothetical protein